MFKKFISIFLILNFILYSQTIGIALQRYDNGYIQYLKKKIENNISSKANISFVDSYNSQSTQNSQIDAFISKKINVIAVNLVNENFAQNIVNKVSLKNIPLIFFNREPSIDVLNSYDKVWYIGGTSIEAGIAQGKLIAETWKSRKSFDRNNDGKIQCIILKGNDSYANNIIKHMKEAVKQSGLKLVILEEIDAMYREDIAFNSIERVLSKYANKVEYIISNNDEMALGALSALRNFGFNNDSRRMLNYIPIIGIGGTLECLNEIKNYGIYATVLQNPDAIADALSKISLNVLNKKSLLDNTTFVLKDNKYIIIPYIPITSYNLNIALNIYYDN